MSITIESIAERLAKVRALDPTFQVFGATQHRYEMITVSPDDLARFEQAYGFDFPEDYRRLLVEIGHGAGPYYGLFSLDKLKDEWHDLALDLRQEEGVAISASAPFPIDSVRAKQHNFSEGPHITTWPTDGCIPICHQGCSKFTAIVTSGPWRGCMWDIGFFVFYEGEWYPSLRPTGTLNFGPDYKDLPNLVTPPTLLEWYDGWLERCLTDLA